jgi:hemerythrin-like domain-containing protein
MKATTILMEEHRVIERVLTVLERAASRLDRGERVDPALLFGAVEFIRGFADGCHHQKEEGVLFPAMAAAGMPRGEGPIAVMMDEHEQARALTRALEEAARGLERGEDAARTAAVRAARDYAALLRQHIQKEDHVLFPMAEHVIPISAQAKVMTEFDRVEREETGAGVHEKFHALAEQLERQAG